MLNWIYWNNLTHYRPILSVPLIKIPKPSIGNSIYANALRHYTFIYLLFLFNNQIAFDNINFHYQPTSSMVAKYCGNGYRQPISLQHAYAWRRFEEKMTGFSTLWHKYHHPQAGTKVTRIFYYNMYVNEHNPFVNYTKQRQLSNETRAISVEDFCCFLPPHRRFFFICWELFIWELSIWRYVEQQINILIRKLLVLI